MLNRFPSAIAQAIFAALIAALGSRAQSLGAVTLSADLAEAGAQVVGVLNKDPLNASQYLGFCEGPSMDAQGNVFFTEGDPKSRILKVAPSGAAAVFASTTNLSSNGTEFDSQGRLVVCQTSTIASYDGNANRTVLSTLENLGENNPAKPNDLTIGSNGAMYFSNWGSLVYYRTPSGQISKFNSFSTSNGIEWVEEQKKLYLSQDGPDQVWVYNVAVDGTLAGGTVFVSVAEPDGITVDEKGNIYVASWNDGAVYVYDSTAKSLGSIKINSLGSAQGTTAGQSGNASNCVIGQDKKLYITGDGGLYSVQLKVGPRRKPGTVGATIGEFGAPQPRFSPYIGSFNPTIRQLSLIVPNALSNGRVRVYDLSMREVWRGRMNASVLEWNGYSAAGRLLSPGRYLLQVNGAAANVMISTSVDLIR